MFVLCTADGNSLDAIASRLRGGSEPPRVWRAPENAGGAASLRPDILPEDATDRQPLVDDDVVFVGQIRLDNRTELLAALACDDATIADSTLVALAWNRWGESSLARMYGDFAFAVWDRRARRAIAVVDPHGEQRVYWSRVRNGLLISAQLAPILAHPDVSKAPDLDALAAVFHPAFDREWTPYLAVRALPGGHLLEWRDGEARIRPWWKPDVSPSIRYRDPNDYVEQTRELFTRAVETRLRTTGRIASTLSGGLDSGLVTATAARQLRGRGVRLTAYTAIPSPNLPRVEEEGYESDDSPYAAEVAALHENIDHRFVSAEGRCLLDLLPEFHAKACTPTRFLRNFVWLAPLSAALARERSRVLLVGQMGNATISWNGSGSIEELLASGRLAAALAQARLEAAADDSNVFRVMGLALKRSLVPRRHVHDVSPARTMLQPEWHRPRRVWKGFHTFAPGTRAHRVAFATTPANSWAPDPTSQWSIEWRDPTIDRRLVECLLAFPLYAFRFEGRDRGLARGMARGLLPERVRLRRTRGAQVPECPALVTSHVKRYESLLPSFARSEACRRLFDLDAVRRALAVLASGALDDALANTINLVFDVALFLCRID